MGKATEKQLKFATDIAERLGIELPDNITFESLNDFISRNRQSYYQANKDFIRNQIISNIKIVDYAAELGFTVIRRGNYYSLKEHDSVRIDPRLNAYWQNSIGQGMHAKGGSVIDFALAFSNNDLSYIMKDFSERVIGVSSYDSKTSQVAAQVLSKEKGELELPPRDSNMRNVFAYLTKTRLIDPDVVQDFVDSNLLYQDSHKNCVFVSYNESKSPVFACLKGTNTNYPFVGDAKNCDYSHCFYINNNSSKMIVTEAVIDTMSIMSILKAKGIDYKDFNHLALSGTGKVEALVNHLREHKMDSLYLAVDHDMAGLAALKNIREVLKEQSLDDSMEIYDCLPENTKDWNDELKRSINKGEDLSNILFFKEGTYQASDFSRFKNAMELIGWKLYTANGERTLWREAMEEAQPNFMEFDTVDALQNYLEDRIIEDTNIEYKFNSLVFGNEKALVVKLAKNIDTIIQKYSTYTHFDIISRSPVDTIINDIESGNIHIYGNKIEELKPEMENIDDLNMSDNIIVTLDKFEKNFSSDKENPLNNKVSYMELARQEAVKKLNVKGISNAMEHSLDIDD